MERHMLDYRTLLEAGACGRALVLFLNLYPEGEAQVSVDSCVAVADKFDWDWAASHLLPAAAQDEYDLAVAPAQTEYAHAVAALDKDRAITPMRAAYNRARAAAWAQAWLTRQSLSQPQDSYSKKSTLRVLGQLTEWWVRAITGRERRATSGRKLAAVAELVTILAERRTETRTRAAWVYGRERGCASWTVTRPADVCGADASDLAPNLRAQWDAWEGELAAANRAAYAEAAAWAETAAWPTAAASEQRGKIANSDSTGWPSFHESRGRRPPERT